MACLDQGVVVAAVLLRCTSRVALWPCGPVTVVELLPPPW
jgi:hypothetical protein